MPLRANDPVLGRRPLQSFSPEVLAEWIRRRGISYFEGEIEAIENEMKTRWQRVPMMVTEKPRCGRCAGSGLVGRGYCQCPMGQDLERAERATLKYLTGGPGDASAT